MVAICFHNIRFYHIKNNKYKYRETKNRNATTHKEMHKYNVAGSKMLHRFSIVFSLSFIFQTFFNNYLYARNMLIFKNNIFFAIYLCLFAPKNE